MTKWNASPRLRVDVYVGLIFAASLVLLVLLPERGRTDVVYLGQFIALAGALVFSRCRSVFHIAAAVLAVADLSYYVIVYKLHFSTETSWLTTLPAIPFGLSFGLFVAALARDRKLQLWRLSHQWLNVPALFFFISVAAAYILIPAVAKLLHQNFVPSHIAHFMSLSWALPLVLVTYLYLTHSSSLKAQVALTGLFALGILDMGIQLETILYGNLNFSYYDVLWFSAVALLASSLDALAARPPLAEQYSIVNLTKKVFFLAALAPILAGVYFTGLRHDLSPMYFIFFLISVFLFGLVCANAIQIGIDRYNRQLLAFQVRPSSTGFDRVLEHAPLEFRDSLFAIYRNALENELNDVQRERDQLTVMSSTYKQMAHDIASPLSVLQLVSRSVVQMDDERRDILLLATQRVKAIADDILSGAPKVKLTPEPDTLSGLELRQLIRDLIREKNVEFGRELITFTCDEDLATVTSLSATRADLIRALSNIINNSERALRGLAEPRLEVRVFTLTAFCRVEIRDNGRGFPADVLAHSFERPYSGERRQGHGLGLFGAKTLLNRWGGQLTLSNQNGAVIWIDLPQPQSSLGLAADAERHEPLRAAARPGEINPGAGEEDLP